MKHLSKLICLALIEFLAGGHSQATTQNLAHNPDVTLKLKEGRFIHTVAEAGRYVEESTNDAKDVVIKSKKSFAETQINYALLSVDSSDKNPKRVFEIMPMGIMYFPHPTKDTKVAFRRLDAFGTHFRSDGNVEGVVGCKVRDNADNLLADSVANWKGDCFYANRFVCDELRKSYKTSNLIRSKFVDPTCFEKLHPALAVLQKLPHDYTIMAARERSFVKSQLQEHARLGTISINSWSLKDQIDSAGIFDIRKKILRGQAYSEVLLELFAQCEKHFPSAQVKKRQQQKSEPHRRSKEKQLAI